MQHRIISFASLHKTIQVGIGCILLVVFLAAMSAGKKSLARPVSLPGSRPTPTISPNIPVDVDIPLGTGFPINFFDDYSWKSFLSMVWPAKDGQRGIADTSKHLGDAGPLVFETFKSDWELFHADGSAPAQDWNTFGDPVPCNISSPITFSDMALVSTSKFGNLGQAGLGNLVGPIVAQNQTYVRYLTGFNKIEFDKIMADTLYLQSHLKNVIFPNGAIDVKSSWVEMNGISHPERYYTRQALVFDPATGSCSKTTVGLVGLHIVQKTSSRPQWIWTTFEQVDNLSQDGAQPPFAFNSGNGIPMTRTNLLPFPPPLPTAPPFNIDRINKIHDSTNITNEAYHQAIRNNGNSVWQFYQLVMTQWPIPVSDSSKDGSPGNTFPGTGAKTSFTNITMETFDQVRIQTGCMNCHNSTRSNSDFLWSLKVNAFPSIFAQSQQLIQRHIRPRNGLPLIKDQSILKLKALLQSTH